MACRLQSVRAKPSEQPGQFSIGWTDEPGDWVGAEGQSRHRYRRREWHRPLNGAVIPVDGGYTAA